MNYLKNYLLLFFHVFLINLINAQIYDYQVNEEVINCLPSDVEIIGLGDPSHQESTITKYRIDLIKKLVEEKQFKIIVIEGNVYELYKSYQKYMVSNDVNDIEMSMYNQLNIQEMIELYQFIYNKNIMGDTIILTGFDVSFSGSRFVEYMKVDLENIDFLTNKEKNDFLVGLEKATNPRLSAIFRNNKKVRSLIVHYARIIVSLFKPITMSDYYFMQALNNIIFQYENISNIKNLDNHRDLGMSKNIDFLKGIHENQKIILFGSSTHLLKNPSAINTNHYQHDKTLGSFLSEEFNQTYYFIAYSAISGKKLTIFNPAKKLRDSEEGSVEFEYKSINSPQFLIKSNFSKEVTSCRFLGHSFVELKLGQVMDGLLLINDIMPAKLHFTFK